MQNMIVTYRIGHGLGFPKTKQGNEIKETINRRKFFDWLKESENLFGDVSVVTTEIVRDEVRL